MQILAIYDIPRTTVIDVFYKGSFQTLSTPGSETDFGYQVGNLRLAMAGGMRPRQIRMVKDSIMGIWFFQIAYSHFIWIEDKIEESYSSKEKVPVDYLLISNNAIRDPNVITNIFEPGLIVLDSSNDYYYSLRAESFYSQEGFSVYNTRNSGGLIIDLELQTEKSWHEL